MGIGENLKGAVKEKLGEVVDDDQLQAEGEAQQRKGEEEARETKERAKAQAHEKKADALDETQEALEQEGPAGCGPPGRRRQRLSRVRTAWSFGPAVYYRRPLPLLARGARLGTTGWTRRERARA